MPSLRRVAGQTILARGARSLVACAIGLLVAISIVAMFVFAVDPMGEIHPLEGTRLAALSIAAGMRRGLRALDRVVDCAATAAVIAAVRRADLRSLRQGDSHKSAGADFMSAVPQSRGWASIPQEAASQEYPLNILTLCTQEVAGRLDDARSLARSLYGLVLLEQALGRLPAPWLQSGLALALASRGRRGDLTGLNRRMLAGLAAGIAWGDGLFAASAKKITKMVTRPEDPLHRRRCNPTGSPWSRACRRWSESVVAFSSRADTRRSSEASSAAV